MKPIRTFFSENLWRDDCSPAGIAAVGMEIKRPLQERGFKSILFDMRGLQGCEKEREGGFQSFWHQHLCDIIHRMGNAMKRAYMGCGRREGKIKF